MSNKNNNQLNIPQAREAMDKFKMQAASDFNRHIRTAVRRSQTAEYIASINSNAPLAKRKWGCLLLKHKLPHRVHGITRIPQPMP